MCLLSDAEPQLDESSSSSSLFSIRKRLVQRGSEHCDTVEDEAGWFKQSNSKHVQARPSERSFESTFDFCSSCSILWHWVSMITREDHVLWGQWQVTAPRWGRALVEPEVCRVRSRVQGVWIRLGLLMPQVLEAAQTSERPNKVYNGINHATRTRAVCLTWAYSLSI